MADEDGAKRLRTPRRQANIYDAVAGRVASDGFLPTGAAKKYTDTNHKTQTAVPPEEVLFRHKGAPVRYEEDDVYFQHRRLGEHRQLPESDLLKVLHAYASDYYASCTSDKGRIDHKSLDGTALIAMGILLEEAAVEALGETGDLALVEKV